MGKFRKEGIPLTRPCIFDTDCISAFLWVKEESLITKLFPGRIIIPKATYDELNRGRTPQLKERIDILKRAGQVIIEDIDIESEEYDLYYQMTQEPESGMRIIGNGEAAAIAMAKCRNGIVASNNLRDVTAYVRKYELEQTTTADIMVDAYKQGLVTVEQAEEIWKKMIEKKRKIGADSFKEYLINIKNIVD